MARSPIFLERRSYRMRRVMDAVRFLPVLGLALWMVPLLWPVPQADLDVATPLSSALKYVFGIWVLLVLAAWALSQRTATQAGKDDVPVDGSG